ncbi:MAG: EAL domain-containing protein, partial [Dokdonella sp.]
LRIWTCMMTAMDKPATVSDRERRDGVLVESEQRFRTVMEHSAVAMALVALDGQWLQVNSALSELLGYSADELRALTFQQLTHPQDLDADLQLLNDLVDGRVASYRLEKRYLRKDGSIVSGLLAVSLVRDALDRPQYLISQIQDISHLKQVEAELYEQRDRLQVTLYSIGDGVITTDVEGRIEFMNPVAESMTGWNLEEVIGKPHQLVFTIVHSESGDAVESPVTACLNERRTYYLHDRTVLVNRHGGRCDIQDSSAPIRARDGQIIGAILVFQDITKVRSVQRELEFKALHDVLTGLPNRRKFESVLGDALQEARNDDVEHALCYLDLDRFKAVNDSAGHAAGDQLLRTVTQVLSKAVRSGDLVARLGGDEFVMILFRCPQERARRIGQDMIETLAGMRFPWEGGVHSITASIGLTRITAQSGSVASLVREADIACYAAKREGRNGLTVYSGQQSGEGVQQRELDMAEEIRNALLDNRFCLHLQRLLATAVEPQQRFEVLVRMIDRAGNLILPAAFIEAAEQQGSVGEIDIWVLREVLSRRAPELMRISNLRLNINLSAHSLNDETFFARFVDLVEKSPLPASALTIESSESALINNLLAAGSMIEKIHALGCSVALDDFGTGFSSFRFLRTFRVEYLKIDGSLIVNMHRNAVDEAIVRSIADIAHQVGTLTVAKCVESSEILEIVRALGIDFAQGHGVAHPLDIDEIVRANGSQPDLAVMRSGLP